MNSTRPLQALGLGAMAERSRPGRWLMVPATEVAQRHLGKPRHNAALLGGIAAQTAQASLESLSTAIRERFGQDPALAGGRNVAAAAEIHQFARQELSATGRAVLDAVPD